jgi:lipopolysaccharide biosynthesis glycosyltransferase
MAKTALKKILKDELFNVYIGYDNREPEAAKVCKASILKHANIPVNVEFIKQDEMREQGIYWREKDSLSSTEFTFTRFLVPYLNNYEGYALFVDCDFLFTADIADLLAEVNPKNAVTVVKHDYTPPEGVKMDGQHQHVYPRKNWSSMIVWNCEHPDNKAVDLDAVNSASGQDLHRFTWLKDTEIGSVSPEWNWLVGWYREGRDGAPKALHYTEGGPWFDNYKNCEYANEWQQAFEELNQPPEFQGVDIDQVNIPPHLIQAFQAFLLTRRDPDALWYKDDYRSDIELLRQSLQQPRDIPCIGVLDGDPDTTPEIKKVDVIIDAFLTGADGVVTMSKKTPDFDRNIPVAIRGIAKRKIIHRCKEEGRPFYYIDTGYFGNNKLKSYHRITKNSMQYTGDLDPNCPDDRLAKCDVQQKKWRPGRNILICPPSQKAMNFWNLDLEEWLSLTITTIEAYTDRPIVIRKKLARSERVNMDTMEMALSRDVHCMVTFNSIAAVESLINGKPVFTMGPNAAQPLANTDLSRIESPFMPSMAEVHNLLCNLSYQQFTTKEMKDGTAWRMLNGG